MVCNAHHSLSLVSPLPTLAGLPASLQSLMVRYTKEGVLDGEVNLALQVRRAGV